MLPRHGDTVLSPCCSYVVTIRTAHTDVCIYVCMYACMYVQIIWNASRPLVPMRGTTQTPAASGSVPGLFRAPLVVNRSFLLSPKSRFFRLTHTISSARRVRMCASCLFSHASKQALIFHGGDICVLPVTLHGRTRTWLKPLASNVRHLPGGKDERHQSSIRHCSSGPQHRSSHIDPFRSKS